MTRAEKHIRHYNNLNGKEISKETLSRFHADLKKDIDSKRIDAHVTFGIECIEIEKRMAKALQQMNGEHRIVHCKTVSLGKPNLLITQTARGPEVVRGKKAVHYHHEDITYLYGIPCIQDDRHLDGKMIGVLDGVSDDVYKVITDRILSLIEAGGLVWRKPWNTQVNSPTDLAHNGVTKFAYRGVNYYLNFFNEALGGFKMKNLKTGQEKVISFKHMDFYTFKQVKTLKGSVKAGEGGWPVTYFKWLYKEEATGALVPKERAVQGGVLLDGYVRIPGYFYYTVFNYEQCSGFESTFKRSKPRTENEKIESAEKIVEKFSSMPGAPTIKIESGSDKAFYSITSDNITVPSIKQFKNAQQFYSVLFHEMVHSTGAESRLNRPIKNKFGSKEYAFEELVAEMGACFLCGESGILYYTMNNSAAYVKDWSTALVKEMKEDPKFFLKACSAAQRATDMILGRVYEAQETKEDNKPEEKPAEKKEAKKDRKPVKSKKEKVFKPTKKEKQTIEKIKAANEKKENERIKEGRKLIDAAKEKQEATRPKDQSSVTDLPLDIIHTDTARFQNRKSEFSEATAQSVAENYDPNKFDPIVVWLDPKDEKIYVLSGHSRFEGMRRRKAKEIPVRYFKGTEEEAIKFAKVDANRSASQETLIEDLAAYKLMRDGDPKRNIKPITKGELQRIFKGRSQRLEAYSHLNPEGLFINALSQGTASNYPYLERNAQWIGSIREFYPVISNTGEDNIFHFFYADKTGKHIKLSKEEFQKLVESKVNVLGKGEGILFPECSSEGCKKSVDKEADPMKGDAYKRLREINEMLASINEKLTSKNPTVRVTTEHERDYLIKVLAPKLQQEKDRIQRDLNIMDKTQATLFGVKRKNKSGSSLSGFGFITADKTPDQKSDTFTLPGSIGSILGKMQPYKLEIVIDGETHSGKSELGKQVADAFLTAGYSVGWIDWEQGGLQSRDTRESIERNVSPANRRKLAVSADVPKNLDAVKSLAGSFDVIVLDSGSSLKMVTNTWIDELREQHPDTIWIILMQQNTKGGTRGGTAAEFDSPVVLKTYRPDHSDFRKNYAYVFKNRGNPQTTGKRYFIAEKKVFDLTQASKPVTQGA